MDTRTREALEASIRHWENNVSAEKPEMVTYGPDHCALCVLFWREDCDGCPVSSKTGYAYCHGSPYSEAERAIKRWVLGEIDADKYRLSVKRELDFLRSLLPTEEEGSANA